jgi:ABC-2 type transport system permease protein
VTFKFVHVCFKGLLEIVRDKRGFALLLVLPVLIIGMFSFAFGSGSFLSGGSIPHEVVVINDDVGAMVSANNNTTQYVNYGSDFTQVLTNATAENSSTNLLHLNNVTADRADDLLKSRSIDALIIIPQNFSSAFAAMVNNSTRTAIASSVGQQAIANATTIASSINASINDSIAGLGTPPVNVPGANVNLPKAGNVSSALTVEGDSGYANFAASQGIISELFDHYKNNLTTNAVAAVKSETTQILFQDSVPMQIQSIPGTQSYSMFDYMVPGLIIFALMLQVSVVAGTLVRDVETGTLDRLKLSKVRSFDLLFGTFVTWSFVAVAQVLILIAVAIVLGYQHQGDFSSLGLATLIGVIAGMASISLALIVASFTKNEQQATILSAMIAVPLSFMAGAFMPLPKQVLGEFGGRTYVLSDVLPWTHAISALRAVLTYGTGLSQDVAFDMTWLVVLTAVLFVVGVLTYSLMRLKAEE